MPDEICQLPRPTILMSGGFDGYFQVATDPIFSVPGTRKDKYYLGKHILNKYNTIVADSSRQFHQVIYIECC